MSSSKAAAGRKPSGSASAIIVDSARGYHIFKIAGYSLTKDTDHLKSSSFTLGGHRWHLRYYPNSTGPETADYMAIYLYLDDVVSKPVKARYQFRFADEVAQDPTELEEVDIFTSRSGWGYNKLIKREEFEKSEHFKDDSFAIRCDIAVVGELRRVEGIDIAPTFISVPPSDMPKHLADLLRTGRGADVVFQVGGVTVTAHRWMLAARSPVFSAELFGAMKESGAGCVVHVHDMEPQVFKALLSFVYTDLFPDLGGEDAQENVMAQHLLVAADRYGMERLKLICEEKLCKCINLSSVATILTLAEQHHCNGLKKACFSFLRSPQNLRAFVASDGFEHLNASCPSVTRELILL